MPRARLRFRMPAKLVARPLRPTPNYIRQALHPERPQLYNAKRLIEGSRGLPPKVLNNRKYRKDPENPQWMEMASEDVRQFVEDRRLIGLKMTPQEEKELLRSPAAFFAKPQNVPLALRKQVYFPDFTVTMRRNQYLGPRHAQFYVPNNFSKLDFKDYLKQLYGVDVLGIQSYNTHASVRRHRNLFVRGNEHRGSLRRKIPRKRMTVHLAQPFWWPHNRTKLDDPAFEKSEYRKIQTGQHFMMKDQQDILGVRLDKKNRQAYADQAKELILRNARWAPTWSQIPENRKLLLGENTQLSERMQLVRNKQESYAARKQAATSVAPEADQQAQLMG